MEIGDRVYHFGVNSNGIIRAIHPNKDRDKYGVEFLWAKYANARLHDLDGRLNNDKGRWCSEDQLALCPFPKEPINHVTMMGNRSLDRLIRRVCEIPQRQKNDRSDIVINYGVSGHVVPRDVFVVNRNLTINKYEQCLIMIEAGLPVPEVSLEPRGRGWIAKPYISMGGRNIFELRRGADLNTHTHYAQRKIEKEREFRAHVFMWQEDQVPLIQEKVIDDPRQLCWNKKQGGAFKYPYEPILNRNKLERRGGDLVGRISASSIRACRSLHYDFGGIDLALGQDNQLYIFEINSRMGLREQSFVVYKRAFGELRTLNIDEYRNRRW